MKMERANKTFKMLGRIKIFPIFYSLLLPLILLLGIANLSFAQEKISPPEWVSLFNGKNLDGWTIKCNPKDKDTDFWKVVDGTIEANSLNVDKHDYVWLLSSKEYTNFIFAFKFLAFKDSPGNSGIQIRSRYDDKAYWLDGPQIDINPPGPWRTGMMWDETRGVQRWIFPNIPKGKWVNESMAPKGLEFYYAKDGKWNEMEITVRGLSVKAVLNGTTVTDFDGAGILNDAIHKEHNVGEKGYIALQIHVNDKLKIRYKDLRIKELPK